MEAPDFCIRSKKDRSLTSSKRLLELLQLLQCRSNSLFKQQQSLLHHLLLLLLLLLLPLLGLRS